MAKIGIANLSRGAAAAVPCNVFYVPKKGYESPYFYVHIPDHLVIENDQLTRIRRQGNTISIARAETESEAIAKAQTYMSWYAENMVKRERLICIVTKDARNERNYRNEVIHREQPKSEVAISFEFFVFFRTNSDGKFLFEMDREWHNENSETNRHHIHSDPEKMGTVLPFTEELAKQCCDMVAKLNDINDLIIQLLSTPEQAAAVLASPALTGPGFKFLGVSTIPQQP